MKVVIENSGAQKALLLSQIEKQWVIEAEGYASQQGTTVFVSSKSADGLRRSAFNFKLNCVNPENCSAR